MYLYSDHCKGTTIKTTFFFSACLCRIDLSLLHPLPGLCHSGRGLLHHPEQLRGGVDVRHPHGELVPEPVEEVADVQVELQADLVVVGDGRGGGALARVDPGASASRHPGQGSLGIANLEINKQADVAVEPV